VSRPRLSLHRHPMFEPHRTNPGWRVTVAGLVLGTLMAVGLVYGMVAHP
jgi:hypothetical protein